MDPVMTIRCGGLPVQTRQVSVRAAFVWQAIVSGVYVSQVSVWVVVVSAALAWGAAARPACVGQVAAWAASAEAQRAWVPPCA